MVYGISGAETFCTLMPNESIRFLGSISSGFAVGVFGHRCLSGWKMNDVIIPKVRAPREIEKIQVLPCYSSFPWVRYLSWLLLRQYRTCIQK